ncbi:acyltransferase [Thermococcus sp. GR6]|nr:acyltransferase [Thermococcus sp. GR6]NJE42896.1 acyltransferase [Thermococcus sp. GR6]
MNSAVPNPEELNKKELMRYWGYSGTFGTIKYYLKLVWYVILDTLARHSPHPGLAVVFHRLRGSRIGKHVYIGPNVVIDFLYPEQVEIEDYVSIGMNTMIFAHANPTNSIELKLNFYPRIVKKTKIKRGAWIAPGCIILPGVTIGENSVVGAGSVVTKDVPPYTVVAGNPAKVIKHLQPKPEVKDSEL